MWRHRTASWSWSIPENTAASLEAWLKARSVWAQGTHQWRFRTVWKQLNFEWATKHFISDKKNFICDQVRNRGSFSKSHLRHSSLNPDNCSCSRTTKTESAFLNLPNQNQTICKIPSEEVKLQLVAFSLVMISFTLSLRFLHAQN